MIFAGSQNLDKAQALITAATNSEWDQSRSFPVYYNLSMTRH